MWYSADSLLQRISDSWRCNTRYHVLSNDQDDATKPSSSINRKIYLYCAALIIIVLIIISVPISHLDVLTYSSTSHESGNSTYGISKAQFVGTAKEVDIAGSFDATDLSGLCNRTNWTEGLVFKHNPGVGGGAGNVRNAFLTGLRFAIEAGATQYVIPRMTARDTHNIANMYSGIVGSFSYLFDQDNFKARMAIACPQMRLYDTFEEIKDFEWARAPLSLDPYKLVPSSGGFYLVGHPYQWRSEFDKWLSNVQLYAPSVNTPVLIELGTTILSQWPIHLDSVSTVQALGQTIRFASEPRRLAAHVLFRLSQLYKLKIDPTKGVTPNAFVGVHLRTESDVGNGLGNEFHRQSSIAIRATIDTGLKLMYVASGDATQIEALRTRAWEQGGITVVTKHGLLDDDELEELWQMTWDQQALVDYEIVLRCSHFVGVVDSSFSMNAMLKRHFVLRSSGFGVISDESAREAELGFEDSAWNSTQVIAKGGWWTDIERNEQFGLEGLEFPPRGRNDPIALLKDELTTIIGTGAQDRVFSNSLWP